VSPLGAQRGPRGERGLRALRLQRALHRGEGARAALLEHGVQRGERFAVLVAGEVEQLHVEIARLAGDLLEPAQLLAQVGERLGREDRLQLAQQRARAADGDAQVVQELAVDVGEGAGQVRLDDRVQAREQRLGGGAGGLARVQLDVELGARAGRQDAGGGDRLVGQRLGGLRQAERAAEHALDALEVLVVAAHGHRAHARPQALGRLLVQPHDGLLVLVEHREPAAARRDPRQRRQRAHLDQRGEPRVQRRREVLGEQPLRRVRGLGGRRLGAGRALEQREPAVAVAQRQPGGVQAGRRTCRSTSRRRRAPAPRADRGADPAR